MNEFKLEILGQCRLRYGESVIEDAPRKVWILLECLYINRERYVSMDELQHILWGDKKMASPANSIKVLIFELRNRIDALSDTTGRDMILNINGGYRLSPNFTYVSDVDEFSDLVNKATADGISDEDRSKYLDQAIALYKGNIVLMDENCYWQRVIRDHYAELYEKVVTMKHEDLVAKNQMDKAKDLVKNAYITNPLSEVFRKLLDADK